MKIQFGKMELETPAKLLIVAITLVVLAAIYFATANFQSLELSGTFSLHSRQTPCSPLPAPCSPLPAPRSLPPAGENP